MYDDLEISTRVYLIYCDIGNHRHWVNDSVVPNKFFDNYDKLCSALKELSEIEYDYYEPTPAQELMELKDNEQELIRKFLTRAWVKTISEARSLKTDKGRDNKIKKFFKEIEPYEERFGEQTLLIIEKAKKSSLDLSFTKQSKEEKDLIFLTELDHFLEQFSDSILDGYIPDDLLYIYNHGSLISELMGFEVSPEIIFDIIGLRLANYDQKKSARYIGIKYKIEKKTSVEIILTASSIARSYNEIVSRSQNNADSKYVISTHSEPCDICKRYKDRSYLLKDAKIGYNYPPLCSHGCSIALITK